MNGVFSNLFSSQTISPASFPVILLSMVLALLAGIFIAWIYRRNYRGVMYSNNFALTLIMMTLITCPVVMCIRESIQLSMGMVGALSIVRFRTAIKEPLDIAFLFWSIAVGIVLAAGLIPLAVFGSVIIGIILVVFANHTDSSNPYIVVLSCEGNESEKRAVEYLTKNTKKCIVKSKTARKGSVELNMEVRLKVDNTDFVNTLADMPGVQNAVLVSFNGDYMG